MNSVYFDNSATTSLSPTVFAEMSPFFLEEYGNPNSAHFMGSQAAEAVYESRSMIAQWLHGREYGVFYTSGGTESDNWAIRSAVRQSGKNRVIASAVEHKAVLATLHDMEQNLGVEFVLLPVDSCGRVDPDSLRRAINNDTALVSVMMANNETGTIQFHEELYDICRDHGILFHCDAVQAMGKIPVSSSVADMISLSGHKFHGPKGVGVLYVGENVSLEPFICGGSQEGGLRGGTTPVPLVVGMGYALRTAASTVASFAEDVGALGKRLESGILDSIPNVSINGYPARRIPGLVNVCFRGIESNSLVAALSRRYGICCSSGSACSEKNTKPSYVLRACGLSVADAHASVRFSLGNLNTVQEVDYVLSVLPPLVAELRKTGF